MKKVYWYDHALNLLVQKAVVLLWRHSAQQLLVNENGDTVILCKTINKWPGLAIDQALTTCGFRMCHNDFSTSNVVISVGDIHSSKIIKSKIPK